VVLVLLQEIFDDLSNGGVLTHQHSSLSSQRDTNLLHLLRSYIVARNDECRLVVLQ
jgi:hypothetical protein